MKGKRARERERERESEMANDIKITCITDCYSNAVLLLLHRSRWWISSLPLLLIIRKMFNWYVIIRIVCTKYECLYNFRVFIFYANENDTIRWCYDTLLEAGEQEKKNSNHVFLFRKLKDREKERLRREDGDEVAGDCGRHEWCWWRVDEEDAERREVEWVAQKCYRYSQSQSKNLMLSNHFKSNISSREIYSLHHNSDARQRPIPNTHTHAHVSTFFFAFWAQFSFCTLCNLWVCWGCLFFSFISSLKYWVWFRWNPVNTKCVRIIENMVESNRKSQYKHCVLVSLFLSSRSVSSKIQFEN